MTTRNFGDLAIESGHTTDVRVGNARRAQRSLARGGKHVFLAELLVTRGELTPSQALSLLERGHGYRESNVELSPATFGDVAVEKGHVAPAELFGALLQQRDEDATALPHRYLGDILIERRQITASGLEDVLAAMASARG